MRQSPTREHMRKTNSWIAKKRYYTAHWNASIEISCLLDAQKNIYIFISNKNNEQMITIWRRKIDEETEMQKRRKLNMYKGECDIPAQEQQEYKHKIWMTLFWTYSRSSSSNKQVELASFHKYMSAVFFYCYKSWIEEIKVNFITLLSDVRWPFTKTSSCQKKLQQWHFLCALFVICYLLYYIVPFAWHVPNRKVWAAN